MPKRKVTNNAGPPPTTTIRVETDYVIAVRAAAARSDRVQRDIWQHAVAADPDVAVVLRKLRAKSRAAKNANGRTIPDST